MLLSLLISAIAASGSLRARQAGAFQRNARLEALADGGIDEAMFHLLDTSTGPQGGHWFANGTEHRIRQADVTLSIRMINDAGKVNPNRAPAVVLVALLQAVGVDQRAAVTIAGNIVAWRFPGNVVADYRGAGRDYVPPGAPFESLSELGLVLGMTPQVLAALSPHLSLYHEGDPDISAADPVVRRALLGIGGGDPDAALPADANPAQRDESVVTVIVEAQDGGGHRFARRAIVVTGKNGSGPAAGERPFKVMSWDAPAA